MSRPIAVLAAALCLTLFDLPGCGASSRRLQSISVTPATADAKNFPNSQVQFTATGTYNDGSTSSSLSVRWSIDNPFAPPPLPTGISLSGSGLAACTGFVGTVSITATAPVDPSLPISAMTMSTQNVSGSAQLTCP
jgi:hypothetical protein